MAADCKPDRGEYAGKRGNHSKGYEFSPGSTNVCIDVAWYSDNSGNETHDVGKKYPNELGIYDMSGNVSEWCWDIYSPALCECIVVEVILLFPGNAAYRSVALTFLLVSIAVWG